jgi:hypothetical protein
MVLVPVLAVACLASDEGEELILLLSESQPAADNRKQKKAAGLSGAIDDWHRNRSRRILGP